MRLQEERAASGLLPQERHGIKGSQPQGTSARAWDDPPSGTNILTQDGSKKLAEEVCVVLHFAPACFSPKHPNEAVSKSCEVVMETALAAWDPACSSPFGSISLLSVCSLPSSHKAERQSLVSALQPPPQLALEVPCFLHYRCSHPR